MNKYTADEAAEKLRALGYTDFTKRTVNYYAFEKGMFDIRENGKGIFTDDEIEKLAGIKLLRTHTNFTLSQIKTIINSSSLDEIKELCLRRIEGISTNLPSPYYEDKALKYSQNICEESALPEAPSKNRTIRVDSDITLTVSERVDNHKLKKIIDFIKNI